MSNGVVMAKAKLRGTGDPQTLGGYFLDAQVYEVYCKGVAHIGSVHE